MSSPAAAISMGVSALDISFGPAFEAGGGSIQLAGTASFAPSGAVLLPITNVTSSTIEHAGAEIIFSQGDTAVTLSNITFVTSNGKTRLYADVLAEQNSSTTFQFDQLPLTKPFVPRADGSFKLVFNEDGAFLFSSNFEGLDVEKGGPFGDVTTSVPEPGVSALLGVGLWGLARAGRRRKA